jgi:hypothetical protein
MHSAAAHWNSQDPGSKSSYLKARSTLTILMSNRRAGIIRTSILAATLLIFTKATLAVELRAETIDAFNRFVASIEVRLEPRFSGQHFLWSDEYPGVRQELLNGAVVAQPVEGNGIVPVKGGLVQDWRGAVFIPRPSFGMSCRLHRISITTMTSINPISRTQRPNPAKATSSWCSCGSLRRNACSPMCSTRNKPSNLCGPVGCSKGLQPYPQQTN